MKVWRMTISSKKQEFAQVVADGKSEVLEVENKLVF